MKKILIGLVAIILCLGAGFYALFKFKNAPPEIELYSYFMNQDMTPEGKTGVFVIGLSTTEDFDPTWWHNIYLHVAHSRIPWPFRIAALADRGVALMDPNRDYSAEKFEPTSLVDRFGRERDMDGTPYIARYRHGEVQWIEPLESIHGDTGYWLYTGRQDGIPTPAAKTIGYARLWYWTRGITGNKMPAAYQQNRIYDQAVEQLNEKYKDVPFMQADTMDPYQWHEKIFAMLDSGLDTIVLASPMVVYSDYEDFHNGFLHSWEIIEEWEQKNGKDIKVIIAPPMGHFKPMRDGYVLMLKDKLDTLPAGSSVKMVWSIHGMPWVAFPNESWLELAPAYTDKLVTEAEQLLNTYDFTKTEVVVSQDHFADHYWNPDDVDLSTNRAYLEGVRDKYDYVVNLPVEFYNENTDTLFYHAMVNYENFPGYDIYNVIDYPPEKWDEPYTKHFVIDDTHIHYLGVPTGDRYGPYIAQAMFDSWDSILSRSPDLLASN